MLFVLCMLSCLVFHSANGLIHLLLALALLSLVYHLVAGNRTASCVCDKPERSPTGHDGLFLPCF